MDSSPTEELKFLKIASTSQSRNNFDSSLAHSFDIQDKLIHFGSSVQDRNDFFLEQLN